MKLVVLACIAALAVPAALAGTRTPLAAPCTTSNLVVWMDTQGSGAAGSVYYKLHFTNLSGHSCTLRGYPGVSAVNLRGRRLGRAAARTASHPHRVTVHNGATASALLRIVEVGNFSRSACHPVTAAGLRVYPPNQTRSKIIPFPFGACSRRGPVFLFVKAVR